MQLFRFFNSFEFMTLPLCNIHRGLISVLRKGATNHAHTLSFCLALKVSAEKCHAFYNYITEMYPGFQILGSSGPLLEKVWGPFQSFGGPANL